MNIFSGHFDPISFLAIAGIIILGYLVFKFSRNKSSSLFVSTPIINSFSKDITESARRNELDPVVGRQKEINHLIMVLSRRTKNNAVLIGEAGVGKTAIVEGLAHNVFAKNVPPSLFGKRVLMLDLNALLAGTKYRGEFEERVRKLTEEISKSKRNIILFIDEIHNLIQAESSGESVSVGDIFKPAMARGELQIVGATTKEEYDQYFHVDLAFKRRMQPIFVNEPSKKETLEILKGVKTKYEAFHNVRISEKVLASCIEQSEKMLPGRSFPDKAIDLMDEASSKARMECVGKNKKSKKCKIIPEVKVEDVKKIAEEYKEVKS
ncbi:MAG TPA: AAA family ATPase [Candidatus Moranbacteria bacterium]|nr:AAA family ATPase [Candidatus Moranbacteria bacterium]